MSWVLALALVAGATRGLSAEEVEAARAVADAGRPVVDQAFASEGAEVAEAVWFVPFTSGGGLHGVVLAPPNAPTVATGELECPKEQDAPGPAVPTVLGAVDFKPDAGEAFTAVLGVTFADLDADGQVDVVAMVGTTRGRRPGPPRALVAQGWGQGAYREAPALEARANALGAKMTLRRIVDTLRPPPLKDLAVTCQQLPIPVAVSEDGEWALVWDDAGPKSAARLVSLETGAPPRWQTAALATAVAALELGCWRQADEQAIHGGFTKCADPIGALNALTAVAKGPTFVPFERAATLQAIGRGEVVLPSVVGDVPNGWLPSPEACAGGLVRATLATPHGAVVMLASARTVVPDRLYAVGRDDAECACSGGTCIHDLVPQPLPRATVGVVFLRAKRR